MQTKKRSAFLFVSRDAGKASVANRRNPTTRGCEAVVSSELKSLPPTGGKVPNAVRRMRGSTVKQQTYRNPSPVICCANATLPPEGGGLRAVPLLTTLRTLR